MQMQKDTAKRAMPPPAHAHLHRRLERKPILASLLGLWMVMLLASCGSNSSSGIEYWVSTGGSDQTGNGSLAEPFRTIQQAQIAVRQNPNRGYVPITVNIEPGTYELSAPLAFDAGDSGALMAPVTYQAAPNATQPVVISGGTPVTGFTCKASLTFNTCTSPVQGMPAQEMPRQFYVNDQRVMRARTNPGLPINPCYTRAANGYQNTDPILCPAAFQHPELIEAVTVTQWKMMRCPAAPGSGLMLVMQNPCWNNANTSPVPWNFQILSWLENAPEFLTGPNMWFYDPYAQTLQYTNPNPGAPQNAVLPVLETLLSITGKPGAPATYITFRNLQFSYATWLEPNSSSGYVADQSGNILIGSGYQPETIGHQQFVYTTPGNVDLTYATHISFDSDMFLHLGGAALELGTGSQHDSVTNSIFSDISSAAIEVGGFSATDQRPTPAGETRNNLISNNLISHTGRDYYDSAAILVGFTHGTRIIHNTISHVPWTCIAIGWGWGLFDKGGFPGLTGATPGYWGDYSTPTIASDNLIASNKFENFLEQLWDGGAIYTNGAQGPNFAHGLLIEYNVAENKRVAAGSNIYYTDGGSQYITLKENVSLNNPVGTVDFGPCGYGSSISSLCGLTGLIPYGADMGGCLPVGDLTYEQNYFLNPTEFFGPQICQNSYIPPYPIHMTMVNNVPTTSVSDVPNGLLLQAGAQEIPGPAWGAQ